MVADQRRDGARADHARLPRSQEGQRSHDLEFLVRRREDPVPQRDPQRRTRQAIGASPIRGLRTTPGREVGPVTLVQPVVQRGEVVRIRQAETLVATSAAQAGPPAHATWLVGLPASAPGQTLLDAHLRDGASSPSRVTNLERFANGARERLLPVDVLPALERREHDGCVHVIGDRDVDGVEVVLVIHQLAPVAVEARVRVLFGGLREHARVDVAERDDVDVGVGRDVREVVLAHAAAPDGGVAQAA